MSQLMSYYFVCGGDKSTVHQFRCLLITSIIMVIKNIQQWIEGSGNIYMFKSMLNRYRPMML